MKTQQTYKISTAVVNSHRILFSKDNLLDLNDPKYNASKNAVASLTDKQVKGAMQVPPDEFYVNIRVGQRKGIVRLYNNLITKSISRTRQELKIFSHRRTQTYTDKGLNILVWALPEITRHIF